MASKISVDVRILNIIAATILFTLGILISADSFHLNKQVANQHHIIQSQLDCDARLIDVLRKRSDARIAVDLRAHDVDLAAMALMNDIKDGEIPSIHNPDFIKLQDTLDNAASARINPDLWAPYPDCEIK